MEGRVPAELEEVFGIESLHHTMILLTCGDYLMGRTAEVLVVRLASVRGLDTDITENEMKK